MINIRRHPGKLIITYLLYGAFIALSLSSCLGKYDTYGVDGLPVVSSDNKYLIVVIAESEAFSHQENGGFVQTTYSTSYWLKQYEINSGKLLKKKELVTVSKSANQSVTCYGGFEIKYGCMQMACTPMISIRLRK